MQPRDILSIVAVVVVLSLLFPARVDAYLDPGTGSFLFQLLIGALVGAGFLLKVYWGKVKSFFTKDSGEDDIDV